MTKPMQYTTIALLVICSFVVMSFKPGTPPAEYTFKSVDNEVAMEVERGKGEVFMHLLVKDLNQFDHIVIERSAESADYFGKCKYISCNDTKASNGALLEIDKYPYTASKDVYYRIKTVTKDGIERIYPSVLLAAAAQ
jgi:hypothetical protein